MTLKDEIEKLVSKKKNEMELEKQNGISQSVSLKNRVLEVEPFLRELKESAREGLIKYVVIENWDLSNTAVIVTLGNIKLRGRCTNSQNINPTGRGAMWYFFPCCSVDGEYTWSFNDQKKGHQWFQNPVEMFSHLVNRVAEEIANYE